MLRIAIINDLNKVVKTDALYKTYIKSELSVTYLILLVGSVGICTLGLLLDYSPVVIGGMLISPLMWPLMKTSIGIAGEQVLNIRRGISMLIFSTIVSGLFAAAIAYLSPVKVLTDEIITRTNPTLLDIFVALLAGGIAALAITQPRISESIAGVAIATSILPPLCVSGIGLALFYNEIFIKGLLLFVANAVSIIFIATITFTALGVKKRAEEGVRQRGIFLTLILLILTAIPLFIFLREYSFETLAYGDIKETITQNLQKVSPNILLDKIKISGTSRKSNSITVEADILIPEDISLSYTQKEKIKSDIEASVQKPVNLTLRIQETISILTEEDQLTATTKQNIKTNFTKAIKTMDPTLSISTLEVNKKENGTWLIKAVLRSDPGLVFTRYQKDTLEKTLSENLEVPVEINLEIIPRILIVEEGFVESTQSTRSLITQ
jgi:uncharacterized hydrophobic protein (TIGR00271 family)